MNYCGKLLGVSLSLSLLMSAHADAVFNIWVEAPERVLAGNTFTVSVWGEVSGTVLFGSDGAMASMQIDLLANGPLVSFSSATIPFMLPVSEGVAEPNALRNIIAVNDYYAPGAGFWDHNPIRLIDVDVVTDPNSTGELALTVMPPNGEDSILAWWVDYLALTYTLDTDPDSSRIITPATVRVVPGQGGVAVLALAGLGVVRRRR